LADLYILSMEPVAIHRIAFRINGKEQRHTL